MRKRPLTIALAVASVIAGTTAGIAAISSETSQNVAEPVAAQTELSAPIEPMAATDANANAATQAAADGMVQPKVEVAPLTMSQTVVASASDDTRYVRIPFTNRQIKVSHPTFPVNSSEVREPSPSVVASYDQKNANTVLVGAAGRVFPSGGDDAGTSPAIVAYFDKLEASKLAALRPQPDTTAALTPPTAEETTLSVPSATTPGT